MTTHTELAEPDRERLDDLIPAAWPTWRRRLTVTMVLGVVAVMIALVAAGLLGPRLVHDRGGSAWVDAEDPDHLVGEQGITLRNAGWVTATIHSVELPDLADVTWGEVQGLPIRLEPGETHELLIPLAVAGCDVNLHGYDVLPIHAKSGVAPARVVQVPVRARTDPSERSAAWPDQPPSWILDHIAAPCATPADGFDDF